MSDVEIFLEVIREGAIVPEYANSGDAGMDIYAAEDVLIEPSKTVIIPTGLKMAIPDGYEIQVRPRSGISYNTPLRISNSPGTIDSGYRGELGIIMTNTSVNSKEHILTIDCKENQNGTYKIIKGDRIAQIVLQIVPKIKFTRVDCVNDIGINRGGGFGSTGVRELK
ncbi:UNVERIFIED_CONTAM: dUTP pyrophosphatase [Acetivibrio alkalicellulosi]